MWTMQSRHKLTPIRFIQHGFRRWLLFSLVLGSIFLSGCATNPVTGKSELSFISKAQEVSIGQEQYLPTQQSEGGLYSVNKELTRYVDTVGQRIASVSDRQLPYEFVVLNNSVPNAWALPGGKIAVNRGLLLKLNSEAELAAVLSHEVIHAAARHGAKSMQTSMLLQGAIMATAIGVSDSEYENYIVGSAQLGAQLLTHRYGRTAELEADYYGIQYMVKAGYDPAAAISLQETFVQLSANDENSWVKGLFASHPPSQERVDKNRETVASLTGLHQDLEIGDLRYKEKIAYLVSKQSAYNAFDQASVLASSNELDSALSTIDRAIGTEPIEPRFYGLKADIFLKKRQYSRANQFYDKALHLDSEYYEYYLGRGLSMAGLGKQEAAKRDLERSNELLPTAVAMNQLGQLSLQRDDQRSAKEYFQRAMSAGGDTGQQAAAAFTELDLPENPHRYIESEVFLDKGRLLARVVNLTNLNISHYEVTFYVTVNNQRVSRSISLGTLGAHQRDQADSGLQFKNTDRLEDMVSRVTVASL